MGEREESEWRQVPLPCERLGQWEGGVKKKAGTRGAESRSKPLGGWLDASIFTPYPILPYPALNILQVLRTMFAHKKPN